MKDLFSAQADAYKRFRPVYPQALYDYILSFVTARDCALDVATGNGQAAVVLANFFKTVYATDISSSQLANAEKKENIEYVQCSAEQTFFEPHTFNLITVAQAYHWLQHEAFAKEIKRVAAPDAVIAIWTYWFETENKKLQDLMHWFYKDVLGTYWDEARRHVDNKYIDLPFPYQLLPTRQFTIEAVWTKADVLGYLSSWSAVQKYIQVNGKSPLPLFETELNNVMGSASIPVYFPIYLLLGRVA